MVTYKDIVLCWQVECKMSSVSDVIRMSEAGGCGNTAARCAQRTSSGPALYSVLSSALSSLASDMMRFTAANEMSVRM